MEYEELLVEIEGQVAQLTLNQPEKLNALTPRAGYELITALEQLEADDGVRAILLTGAGRGFCAGVNLGQTEELAKYQALFGERRMKEHPGFFPMVVETLGMSRKPTLCAVNGVAAGLGLALALACDIRYASESARFQTIFMKRAMVAHGGMAYYLPRAVGTARALEMLWTSRPVDARRAEEIGLVSEVIPADELLPRTLETAHEIASGPTVTQELDKKVIYDAMATNDLRRVMQLEGWASALARNTEDSAEGLRSFAERREPAFEGR